MDERSESGVRCITERTEAMHNMKKLILSIFTFLFATATHAQQLNTLLAK
jgi:hypothetical protein